MNFSEVPIGFGFALAQNEDAMNAFAMMTKQQKQDIWAKARRARSEKEMHQIVTEIVTSQ